MHKTIVRLVMPVLVLALAIGCSEKTSDTNAQKSTATKADYAVEVTVEPTAVTVPASGNVEVVFTISNEGEKEDTYELETGDEFFGKKALGQAVPASVTLQAGESKELRIPLTFERSGSLTVDFDVSITAISQGDSAIKDTAACKISFK